MLLFRRTAIHTKIKAVGVCSLVTDAKTRQTAKPQVAATRAARRGEFPMMTTAWIILIYGLLVAAGGLVGYVKAHSTISLATGVIAGLLLVGAGVAMMRSSSSGAYQIGWWLALTITVLILGRFGVASLNNFKMMPGGLVITLSVIAIIALLLGRTPPPPI